jgi:dynein heavy chain
LTPSESTITPGIQFILEVDSLSAASIATISRCGVVTFQPEDIGWQALLQAWMKKFSNATITGTGSKSSMNSGYLEPHHKAHVVSLCDKFIESALKFLKADCTESIVLTDAHMIISFTNLLESLLSEEVLKKESITLFRLNFLFTFAMIWSFGGHLTENDRDRFDRFIRKEIAEVYQFDDYSPDSVYEYCIIPDGTITTWKEITQGTHPKIYF